MILKEFKEHIESAEKGLIFSYGISQPFSWRGVYTDVAFELIEEPMSREEILSYIDMAYDETFVGYKGGEYEYNDYTEVHFEEDYSSYTDGMYCARMIAKIENTEIHSSQEARLISFAFPR